MSIIEKSEFEYFTERPTSLVKTKVLLAPKDYQQSDWPFPYNVIHYEEYKTDTYNWSRIELEESK